jgi:hypothetical protein
VTFQKVEHLHLYAHGCKSFFLFFEMPHGISCLVGEPPNTKIPKVSMHLMTLVEVTH